MHASIFIHILIYLYMLLYHQVSIYRMMQKIKKAQNCWGAAWLRRLLRKGRGEAAQLLKCTMRAT